MAKKMKISQMPEKTQLTGSEYIPIVDGSSNKKVKTDKLLTKTEAEEDYQEKLVSGTNIKTVNGESVLGNGNIEIAVPDTSNLLTEEQANQLYQVKGDYATVSDLESKLDTDQYNTDKANFALKSEIPDTSDMLTKTEAGSTYQPIGDYALKSEIPTVPTKVSELTNDSNFQTEEQVTGKIEKIIGAAPEALDTLKEIADALNNDPDFATTITNELSNKVDVSTYNSDKANFATKDELSTKLDTSTYESEKTNFLTKTEAEENYATKDEIPIVPTKVSELENDANYISQIKTINGQSLIGDGNIEISGGGESGLISDAPADNKLYGRKNNNWEEVIVPDLNTINLTKKSTAVYELQVGDRIAGTVDISSVGMYYPGVKVDTQKLFALTKGSTEDEIKAALQLETSSGSYTLPTAEILDTCIGKGYQLLSNWMPVSVAWNGAGYVLYIIGQNYMNKPNGLYTVTIKITDGVYSVFQAAKFVEFVSKDYVDQVAGDKTNVLILSLEDDLANGEKGQPVTPEISEKLVDAVDTGKACVIKTANSDILANLQKIGDNVTIIMEQVSRISTYFIAVNTAITVNTVSNIIADYSTGAINLADSSTLATKEEVQNKQDKLISGTNIKTVNGNSLLGEGDITIDVPDTSDMLTKTEAAGIYAKNSDLVYIADTVIPQMNTNTAKALDQKVDWDEEKKVISLPADGSISALRNAETLEGGVLLAQRTYDDGVTYVTEIGTTKNSLTLNSTQRPKVDLQGGTSEELAYVDDLRTLPVEINIPIRSLKDQIYDQSTILGWFGIEEASDLKKLIASGGIQYLRYGITLTGTPRYYKMPVEYVAFESNNQIKLVCLGLDTTDDSPTRYTFILNLDGTIASGNSNVSMTLDPIKVDLSNYYTKEEVDSKYQAKLTAGNGISIEDGVISSTLDVNLFRVVSALPEEDIETDKIYLVPSSTTGENNIYTEYTYVNSAWEKLGEYNSSVDLTDYLTKEEATELYQPVGNYATKTELNSKLDVETYNQEKTSFLTAVPSEYITETELEEKDYITSTEASETYQPKGNYATLAQVQAKQDQLVSGTNIKTVNGASLLGSGDITIETPEGGIVDAAQDNKIYGRCNGSWVEIPSLSTVDGGTYTTEPTTRTLMNTFALKSAIPTKVSELENDSIYVTDEELEEKMKTKVTGIGLSAIQVVEELPEVQESGVLYLVVGKQ